jgi:diaminopimelate epimerase
MEWVGDNRRVRIRFTKMQGAGNDFVMLNGIAQPFALDREQLRRLADRRFGIGADQILLVERPTAGGFDFRYRIFNADGGEVEQCGNGARCFVKFVRARGLTQQSKIRVETLAGPIEPWLEADGEVTVDMGVPRFEPEQIPFAAGGLVSTMQHAERLWPLSLAEAERAIGVVSMGNPHAVQVVDDVDAAPVAAEGPQIERHPRCPQRVNAGFMQILDRHTARLRVWERGTGETLACGTGACAAAASGIRRGLLDSPVAVHARGGRLRVAWTAGNPVLMTGPAEEVFEGEIDI